MCTRTVRRLSGRGDVINSIIEIIFEHISWDNQLKYAAVTAETAAILAQCLVT